MSCFCVFYSLNELLYYGNSGIVTFWRNKVIYRFDFSGVVGINPPGCILSGVNGISLIDVYHSTEQF